MFNVVFPHPKFDIKTQEGKEFIKDPVRRKWVRLTPEEWVRQNWINYLITVKQYPASLFAIEKEILIGEVKKRCDIVVYKQSKPWMIIECKQPEVAVTESTLMQAIHYNLAGCCSYLIISNGNDSKGWRLANGAASELKELPDWEQ